MGFLSSIFGKKDIAESQVENPVLVDMHSHLLPAIDDGSDSFESSIAMITELAAMGYKKCITTPHVMADFYRNTPEIILPLCAKLNEILQQKNVDVKVEASAEYYLDENFENLLRDNKLMGFGPKNYILIETSFLSSPANFNETIFNLKIAGYTPILAHPERYSYMYDSFDKYKAIFDRDICFQVNLGSLAGYYSKDAKRIAERLIKEKMVHFVGTDIHHLRHIKPLQAAQQSPAFQELTKLKLMNNSLL